MRGGLLLLQASPSPPPLRFISLLQPCRLCKPSLLRLRYPPPSLVLRSTPHRIDQETLAVVAEEEEREEEEEKEEEEAAAAAAEQQTRREQALNVLRILASSSRTTISTIRTAFVRALVEVAISRFKFRDPQDPSPPPQAPEYPSESSIFSQILKYLSKPSPSAPLEESNSASKASPLGQRDSLPESPSPISTEDSLGPSSSIGNDSLVDNLRVTIPELSEEIVLSSQELEKGQDDAPYVRPGLVSPGFSFSAAGFLFPYHLGVAQCLIEHGYIKENTPLSGSSAGAIVSAVIASGMTIDDAMLATKELAADCRKNGTAFRIGVVLRKSLEGFLPEDAHIRSNGRIQVAITQVFGSPKALIVSHFDSRTDLIDGLLTSSFIPGYFAARPVTMYRKRICVDGGLTQFMPPTSADRTVKVCAFSASRLGLDDVGICPDCNPTRHQASPRQLLNWALEPAADEILDDFFEMGYQDALVWVRNVPKF